MTSDRETTSRVRRREALAALGTMGVTGLIGGRAALGGDGATAQAADSCILTPEVTEGPYYIDTSLTRRDIRGGKGGLPVELTVFPGWYRGRTPHIHLKVHVGGEVVHTGQVFFNEATTARVYRQAPYSSHGPPDTSHAEDNIYAQAGRSRAVMRLRRRTRGRRGYRGTITLGVAT